MSSLVPTAQLAVPFGAQHQAKRKGEDGALSGRKPPARFGVRKADKRTSPVIAAVAHRFVRLQGTGTGRVDEKQSDVRMGAFPACRMLRRCSPIADRERVRQLKASYTTGTRSVHTEDTSR